METQPKKVYVSTPHLKRYLIINQLHFTPVAASRHLSRHLLVHLLGHLLGQVEHVGLIRNHPELRLNSAYCLQITIQRIIFVNTN